MFSFDLGRNHPQVRMDQMVFANNHHLKKMHHLQNKFLTLHINFITPHVQRERGKVIDRGVHIYVCGRKKN